MSEMKSFCVLTSFEGELDRIVIILSMAELFVTL